MCPDIFTYDEKNLSTVKSDANLAESNLQSAQEARDVCPVDAITIDE